MEPFVNVIIILCACVIFVLIAICCFPHRKKEPLSSQHRDLEMGVSGTKDGGLVFMSGNNTTTSVAAAAVTTAASDGPGCGGGNDGGGGDG
ncbi:hypothetical protein CARUB_v10012020mg, partial [Capsella rubella]